MELATMAVPTSGLFITQASSLSPQAELRHLPPSARARLCHLLDDSSGHWQLIMAAIPCTPPWTPGMPLPPMEECYQKKYSSQDIRLLENAVAASGHLRNTGGINQLLEEWGTSGVIRPTIADLINLLDRHKLHVAALYLRREVLKESSSDDSTKEFEDLDLIMEEKIRIIDSQNTNGNIESQNNYSCEVIQFSESVLGVADLDNLLDERHVEQLPKPSADTLPPDKDMYGTLDSLTDAREATNSLVHNNNVRQPVHFDASVKLVSHFSYNLLHEITNGFSDVPYQHGGRKVGEGAFGTVYKACLPMTKFMEMCRLAGRNTSDTETDSFKQLAIKKLNSADERVDKQFKMEVEILSECCHPNILPLEGYSCDGPHWCLLYAFMMHGNLLDRLSSEENVPALTALQRMMIGRGMADGLAYLHTFSDSPMIHRDIKSANILLDANLLPKIGDFGLVRLGGNGSHASTLVKTTTVFGTSVYMAPEAFRGDVSVKLDTFSYGVVLLELLTGLPPYDETRDGRDLLSHVEGIDDPVESLCDERAMPWPEGLPQALLDHAMLCFEEKKVRPSMVEIAGKWQALFEKWG